jgi:hypothetical protein
VIYDVEGETTGRFILEEAMSKTNDKSFLRRP